MSEKCLHRLLEPQRRKSLGSSTSMRLRRLSQPTPPRQRKPSDTLLRRRRSSLGQQEERLERAAGSSSTHSRRRRSATHRRCTLATLAFCQLPSDASSPASSPTSPSTPSDFPTSFLRPSSNGEGRRSNGSRGSPWHNLRRAWSLISVSCWRETLAQEERKKEAKMRERKRKVPKGILRPPTRYCYHRGVSGLPVSCNIVTRTK
ncbi:uncharacterized protein LOC127003248 [Eriocheir sinensis]|uniref:uncharacterized protein LOC127003248 n=1 Tax=Eriocheir sinensis TaxID=95602 RepID=UPI0021C7BC6D|nr:uncharacterized protein LOC127003248 [Eriocheir sinensis]